MTPSEKRRKQRRKNLQRKGPRTTQVRKVGHIVVLNALATESMSNALKTGVMG